MNSSITSVITQGGPTRCITASAAVAPGDPGISIRGVTPSAAREIRMLVVAAAKRRGIRLPRKAVIVDLAFDVPFESTSELAFASLLSIAGTICPSDAKGENASSGGLHIDNRFHMAHHV